MVISPLCCLPTLKMTDYQTVKSLLFVLFFPTAKEDSNMADFMIRFLLSNLFLGIFIGILAFCKWIFRRTLSSQMQYHLWFLLFFFLLVPFVPVCSFSLPAQISSFFSTFPPRKDLPITLSQTALFLPHFQTLLNG